MGDAFAPNIEPETNEDDLVRLVARLSSDYVLRVVRLIADAYGGSIITAVVGQAIIAANTAHLGGRSGEGEAWTGHAPPDELRRPVSVLALARSLDLPFETTRRHVQALEAAGRCVRVRGGVIVPASALEHAASMQAAELNLRYVRHYLRVLKAAGVSAD
jgi:hypothetical protein